MKDRPATDEKTTREVGDEGGGPGEVEIGRTRRPGAGSEAGETWSPATPKETEIRRDETGEGKRSPS